MKKLFILALLLGLTGCGDNNQSDTQTNNQTSTLQKAEIAPAVASYSMAASPRTFGAVAPLQGWSVLTSEVLGAETIIEAGKGQLGSIAAIRPNAKQVAELLRGGAAGIALSIAVDQLLGAVDWVMDPANNQIKYKTTTPDDPSNNQYRYRWDLYDARWDCYSLSSCVAAGNAQQDYYIKNKLQPEGNRYTYDKCVFHGTYIYCTGKAKDRSPRDFTLQRFTNPLYNPTKTLPLEAIAEQVITNADAGSLDAQVATNLAAQNILNDVVQAEPVVQELEENAKYAGVAPRPNNISHGRENEILNMKPNDPCNEISQAIKDLDETIQWRKSDLNPKDIGKPVYVGHQKRIRILNNKKDDLGRAYKVWCEGK